MGSEGVGDVYANVLKTGGTEPYRAETKSVTLFYLRILVTKTDVKIGRQGSQDYPIVKDDTVELWNVDLADLYFKNGEETAVVFLLGTTKP